MRIVRSWLEEFVDVRKVSDEQLADAITSLGLSVEATEVVGTAIAGVVVAKVLRTERHPEANKVHRVWVDAGDGGERHVWCGAFNMKAGDLVPLATIGTKMPDGREILRRGMFNIDSEGMLVNASMVPAKCAKVMPLSTTRPSIWWNTGMCVASGVSRRNTRPGITA
ncbi:MAG: hypothetical protein EBV66_05280 [Actinobacteria bacterium]|nr:hypothetical protein [Actinomycetota bacterium]